MRRTRAQGREPRNKTGEGGGEVKKLKKLQKNYRRDVEDGRDLGGWLEKKRRQESVGSVDVDPGISKE